MSKKITGIIIAVVVLCAVGIGTFFLLANKDLEKENQSNNNASETIDHKEQNNEDLKEDEDKSNSNTENGIGKVLVVYFSATNNTKSVAEEIAENLNVDLFEIVPTDEYTSEDLNYSNPDSRVSKEHDDESLRNVQLKTTTVDN